MTLRKSSMPRHWTTCLLAAVGVVVLLFVGLVPSVLADYGDAVDPTFQCPAFTTCKQVCVASISKCPSEMLCPSNQTLCPDGTCTSSTDGSCQGHDESPCEFDCAPIACHKVDNDHDSCVELYGALHDLEAACGEAESTEKTHLYSFTEPGFVFCYVWISAVTAFLLGWCAFNQRLSPVSGSARPLETSSTTSNNNNTTKNDNDNHNDNHNDNEALEELATITITTSSTTSPTTTNSTELEKPTTIITSWQTGYKFTIVGRILFGLTSMTFLGIQILLLWLTLQYYVQQELITTIQGTFEDEKQVLLAFEITWLIGFFWSFALKFPFSIRGLHYRRCVLGEATHVAICVHEDTVKTETFDSGHIKRIRWFFTKFYALVHSCMTFVFSDQNTFGHPRTGKGVYAMVPVETDEDGTRFFMFRFRRYNLAKDRFVPGVVHMGSYVKDIINADKDDGLSNAEVKKRRHVVGDNAIHIRRPNYFGCLVNELSKPFYTYQNFMVWSWFPMWYYYMAFVWTVIILVSAFTVSFFHYRNKRNLYRITKIRGDVEVLRDGKKKMIPHQQLVPGDVITVGSGVAFCDMVLVSCCGSTLVDESALTGEANPVGKLPLDPTAGHDEYSTKRHKRSTILAGTTVLEVDDGRAVVMQIASFTARGELIRDIHSFERHQFKFDVEVPVVITILLFYAIFGLIITNYFIGDQMVYGFFYGIYVVGTILPPLLPTVFTVSVGISDDRLARKRVACTNSESILVAGKVTRAFFDKTGTLTKQGLDFLSARSVTDWKNGKLISPELATGMAVCHTLTRVKGSGELVGNPVDSVMFEASRSTMFSADEFQDKYGNDLKVLRHFDFDHKTMTQSVIARSQDGSLTVYVKGSGERMKKLCRPESLPPDFDAVLRDSARQGIYQISMGNKSIRSNIDIQRLQRSEVESDLTFAGVINFKNTLRESTPGVIQHLAEGDIQSIMVTGDSILTGICIAKECGILRRDDKILVGDISDDSQAQLIWRLYESDAQAHLPSSVDELKNGGIKLAISGEGFERLRSSSPNLATVLMDYIRVYGRCTPNDKVAVVTSFVNAGYITMMCGDGGNDCGALKTAHVGVALSDAEASTVAPFTSLDKCITSVVEVLREGRCALASAFASYKYMIIYGQTETFNQMIHAYFATTFSEWCWVFMDGVWTVTLAFALPLARAAPKLAPTRPTASILGIHTLSSVFGVLVLNFAFVFGSLAYLWSQDWFQCRMWTSSDVSNVLVIGDNYETEVLFVVAGAQYISAAMAFNFGYEFRRGWFRNYVFVALAIGFATMHLYVTMNPGNFSCLWRVNCDNDHVVGSVTFSTIPIQNDFNTTLMPEHFQRGLVGIVIGNALAIAGWEFFVVNGIRRRKAAQKNTRKSLTGNGTLRTLQNVGDEESSE